MYTLLERAHAIVQCHLSEGDVAVDATVGNGHDTLFLAGAVGETGRVVGFDVQAQALSSARERLEDADCMERVRLYECGHEQMQRVLGEADRPPAAVMFNLGYLPGSDKEETTQVDTTLDALEQTRDLLAPGGVVTLVCYPGHAGGEEETRAVRSWCAALDSSQWRVQRHTVLNARRTPPELIAFVRR